MPRPVGTERVPSILSAMANPAKRKVSDDPTQGPDPASTDAPAASDDEQAAAPETPASTPAAPEVTTPTAGAASTTKKPDKVVPPKAKARAKASPQATPARHTPAKPATRHTRPSPRWVPVLMFALWGIGLLLIILNYMGVLPGAADGGNGWYLVAGLVSILAGIMVATQYH